MKVLCIVSCGKQKIWDKVINTDSVKSKDIYTGIFTRKCIEYAEKFLKDSYYILSAKHGLLFPDETVKGPYDECFHIKKSNPITKEELLLQIRSKKLDEYDKIIILGGKFYTTIFKDICPEKVVTNPLDGCQGIGKMMKKLNDLDK
jgi:hypothetical protein